MNKDNHSIWDEEGFWRHCEVAALIFRELGKDPHTNHHIRAAIREASYKVRSVPGREGKSGAKWMSKDAESKMISGDCSALIADHVVPISVITEMIYKAESHDKKSIGEIVREWSIFAVITKQEHEKLRLSKLYHRMPPEWNHNNKFARYEAVGIELKKNTYLELCK